jgi:paraquat-inducible protein A
MTPANAESTPGAPRSSPAPGLVACPCCDLLFDVGGLRDGEKARCTRCGEFLTRVRGDALVRLQCYAITGLVCLAIGCSFPFLSFKSSGLESVVTLPQTVVQLYDQGRPDLSFLVAAFIIGIPAAVLVLLLALATGMVRNKFRFWMVPAARLVFHIQNWSMVEVFFIGVLVSLVKIGHMATVVMGLSFWGYGAFALFFIFSIGCLDRLQCWNTLERLAETAGGR